MVNFNQSPNPLIDAIETIFKASSKSEIQLDRLEKCKEEISLISDFFSSDDQQTVVLSILLWLHFIGEDASVKELLDHTGLRLSSSLYIHDLLKPFVEADWIKPQNDIRYYPFTNYRFNSKVLHCFTSKTWKHFEKRPCENSFDVLKEYGKYLKERRCQDISYGKLIERTDVLLKENEKTPICTFLKISGFDTSNNLIFLSICYNHFSGNETFSVESLLDEIRPTMEDQFKIRQDFKSKKGVLFNCELIEKVSESGMSFSDNDYKLSEAGVQKYFPEYTSPKEKSKSNILEIIEHQNIVERELFYNKSELVQVERLFEIVKPENFSALSERLEKKGKKTCITAIFYGSPGTGKTETALQLAKSSGRAIFMADVSTLRSKWVGDTEKNTKKLFSDYAKMRKTHDLCPILLFNEADSILSKRRQVTDKVDQMENAMQNLILQELETFEGIFIATTNLEQNLDPAYDRRITFKIKYSAPNEEARLSIWKQKLPETGEDIIREVNKKYKLTGGQIDNICRKIEVDTLLKGEEIIDLPYLEELAEEENSLRTKDNRSSIGFKSYQHNN